MTLKYDDKNNGIKLPIYTHNDNISGSIDIDMDKCKKWEHLGVRLELVGQIETTSNKNVSSSEFMSMGRELEP